MKTTIVKEIDMEDIHPAVAAASIAMDMGIVVYGFNDSDKPWRDGSKYYLRRDADVVTALRDQDYDLTPEVFPNTSCAREDFAALEPAQQEALRELVRSEEAGELDGDGFDSYMQGWNVNFLSADPDDSLQQLQAYVKYQKGLYPGLNITLDRGGERL